MDHTAAERAAIYEAASVMLKEAMAELGVTVEELAQRADTSASTIRGMLNCTFSYRLGMIAVLAKALGISVHFTWMETE